MLTTRNINVDLSKEKLKLRHVTTKDIDVGVRVEPPKRPIKTKSITTTTLPDIADIAEKKRRDDIAVEKKLAMKDEKKIVIAERPKLVEPSKTIEQFAEEEGLKIAKVQKKPWKLMTDGEKKVEYKERAKRAAATRATKKK